MRLRDKAARLVTSFKAGRLDNPHLEARLIIMHVTRLTEIDYIMQETASLTHAQNEAINRIAHMRLNGKPLSRIVGHREFYGLAFNISPDVLDPRGDSESVIEAAHALMPQDAPRILDLGTGSGCLLINLLHLNPHATGVGVDISEAALTIARQNAARHGVCARAQFYQSDWLSAIDGVFDLIIANPPYIKQGDIAQLAREVRDHDPYHALNGGVDGLACYRAIIPHLAHVMTAKAHIVFELGYDQYDAVHALLSTYGFTNIDYVKDLHGIKRVIVAQNK